MSSRASVCRRFAAGMLVFVLLSMARAAYAAQPAAPTAADRKFELNFEAGLLTVQARDVPLDELLYAIGDAAGFEVTIGRDLGGKASIDVTREALPKVFRRLLEKNSYLVFFDARKQVSELRVLAASARDDAPLSQPAVINVDEPTAADLEIWILDRLASSEQDERIVAVRRLEALNADTAVNLASNVLQTDSSPAVRGEAVAVLGRIGGERIYDPLQAAALDGDATVRRRAISVWQSLGGARAIAALGQLSTTDGDSGTRLAALRALQAIGGDEARYYLEQAIADGSAEVRQFAAQALEAGETRATSQPDSINSYSPSPATE